MRVFYSADNLPVIRNAVVTVGSYDGVHYGHRVLLDKVKQTALNTGGESVVVTFWPHPRKVLLGGGNIKLLNTLQEKIMLLGEAGIENLVILPFTPAFAAMTSSEFVRDILVGCIGMKNFVVGYNHHFGSDRGGDCESLAGMQAEFGFTTERIQRNDIQNEKVSSTIVRNMIEEGQMKRVKEFLLRGFLLIADIRTGNVVIPEDDDKLIPPAGRYEVDVEYGHEKMSDMLIIKENGGMFLEKGIVGEDKDALITFV